MTATDGQPFGIILGAGIAGLSAAYFLKQRGVRTLVLEKSATYGGLARSFRWNGFWCDFAAHRLFTDDPQVLKQVRALVPLHHHQRRSKIRLRDTWMSDPIDMVELATHLPPTDTARLIGGYLTRPRSLPDDSFEHYVLKRYGVGFYDIFFRSYTERLFSLPGDQIAVEWARRKVRLASPLDRFKKATKTKFTAFHYPVSGGYGAIADALYQAVRDQVVLGAQVTRLERDANSRVTGVYYQQGGEERQACADYVISTLPLTLNARFLGVDLRLEYQKVDAVYLLIDKPAMTENHWLYFMDHDSALNRIVEFKQMSPVDTDPDKTVVCAEVTADLADPVSAVIETLVRSDTIAAADVMDSHVIREPFAYPRYRKNYPASVKSFERALQEHANFYCLGRSAQFEHFEVDDLIGSAYTLADQLVSTTPQPGALQPSQPNPVWIVVLAWNNYEDTAECLTSLGKLTYPHCRIVLVDNGSTDGTPERVRAAFPETVVIENGANLGVPAGYNVGFRYALQQGADSIFMINNDTTVDPAMIDQLVAAAAHTPDAGILTPIVYYYDTPDAVWSSGARYRRFPPAIVSEHRLFRPPAGYHELEYAISCGLLITRRAFEQAGLFDENYRFLWDDLDFSERVRRQGLKILQVPDAKMWHKISRTTRPGSALFWQVHGESGAIFYRRHSRLSRGAMVVHLGYFALREFAWKWRWHFFRPFLRGLRQGLTRNLSDVPRIKDDLSYPG